MKNIYPCLDRPTGLLEEGTFCIRSTLEKFPLLVVMGLLLLTGSSSLMLKKLLLAAIPKWLAKDGDEALACKEFATPPPIDELE